MITHNDTITAIATPSGRGALGVVRISGQDAVDVARRIFVPKGKAKSGTADGGALSVWVPRSHRMEYGTICANGAVIDEVMLCVMLAPRSFTREDVVEIYAHGGTLTMQGVLQAALAQGARLAEPGEFTRRAFVNGRLNLAQAEAVMDIIHAGSEAARTAGLRQLGGGLSRRVEACREVILRWLAHISLSVDYPEHEEEAANRAIILAECPALLADMRALLQTAEVGRVLREGVKTAIAGAPNAGKSTLLNAILGEDRAITHATPGTTRDILTEAVTVGGVPLVLMDTAGLRQTDNEVEQMGVERTRAAIQDAELVLWVVDGTTDAPDSGMYSQPTDDAKKIIILINKCDLEQAAARAHSAQAAQTHDFPVIPISAKTGQGMTELFDAVRAAVFGEAAASDTPFLDFAHTDIITRERHRALIADALSQLEAAAAELHASTPEDMVAIRLRGAYLSLGHILGEDYADDIVERIFAEFCVGK